MIRKEALAAVLGSPIAYYTVFAKALGCVEAGIFAAQMFYWHGKGHDPDGWIYKTQEDIFNETGLTRRNQEMARRKMGNGKDGAGVLEEVKRGVPAKLYYRLNMERLFEVVQEYLDAEAAAAGARPPDPADADMPEATAPPDQSNDPPEVDDRDGQATNKDVQSVHPRMSKTRILESTDRTSLDVQVGQTGMREVDILESANRTDKDARFGRANTKTTSKTTTETTHATTAKTTTTTTNGAAGGAMAPTAFEFMAEVDDVNASRWRSLQLDLTMRTVAADLMTALAAGGWRNSARYLADLTPAQLETLVEWLWLWRLTDRPPAGEYEEVKRVYGKPFAGLDNVPGYIITQVRDGQRPTLDDYDREQLTAFLAGADDVQGALEQ